MRLTRLLASLGRGGVHTFWDVVDLEAGKIVGCVFRGLEKPVFLSAVENYLGVILSQHVKV